MKRMHGTLNTGHWTLNAGNLTLIMKYLTMTDINCTMITRHRSDMNRNSILKYLHLTLEGSH